MAKKDQPDPSLVLLLSLIPGVGHMILGWRGRGLRLFFFSVGMIALLVWHWEACLKALSAPDVGTWIAPVFLIASIGGSVIFSFFGCTPPEFLFTDFSLYESLQAKRVNTTPLKKIRENPKAVSRK